MTWVDLIWLLPFVGGILLGRISRRSPHKMMKFDVTPDEGEAYQLEAGSRDVLAWERAGRGRSFSELGNNLSMIGLYGLSYHAAVRQGRFSGTLAEWEQSVDLTPVAADDEDDDELGPTREGHTPGPSSS